MMPVGAGAGKVGFVAALFVVGPGDGGDRDRVRPRSKSWSGGSIRSAVRPKSTAASQPCGGGKLGLGQHVGNACARRRWPRLHRPARRFTVDGWEQGRSAKCRHHCAEARPKSAGARWRGPGITSITVADAAGIDEAAGQVHRAEPQRLGRGGAGQADLQAGRFRPRTQLSPSRVIRLLTDCAVRLSITPAAQKAASTARPAATTKGSRGDEAGRKAHGAGRPVRFEARFLGAKARQVQSRAKPRRQETAQREARHRGWSGRAAGSFAGSPVSSRASCQARCQPKAQTPAERDDQLQRVAWQAAAPPAPPRAISRTATHQERAQPGPGVVAEQPGGGFDADQRVILAVLMGIDRVVEQRPGDACGVEEHRRRARGCRYARPTTAARPS